MFILAAILYVYLIIHAVWFYNAYPKQKTAYMDGFKKGNYGVELLTLIGFIFVSGCLIFQKKPYTNQHKQ